MKKTKALTALWLAVVLVATMIIPTAATGNAWSVFVYSDAFTMISIQQSGYTNFDPYTTGEKHIPTNKYTTHDVNNNMTSLSTELSDAIPAYMEISGWNVWTADTTQSGLLTNRGALGNQTLADLEMDYSDYYLLFEPVYTKDLRAITKQPTQSDPTVVMSHADIGETYLWSFQVIDPEGNTSWGVLRNETTATLQNWEAGTTYQCSITYPDGKQFNSDLLTFELPAADDGSDFNAVFLLLILKNSIRYYDGNTRVDTFRITKGEAVEPLTLEDKDGMTLEGWYIDKELTEKFDFTQPIENGLQLYAKWVTAGDSAADEPVGENETAE